MFSFWKKNNKNYESNYSDLNYNVQNNNSINNNINKIIKEYNKKIENLEKENLLLKIENEQLKNEISKLKKIADYKVNLQNLDKEVILIFHPYNTYQELTRAERPDVAEEMALYLYNDKLIKLRSWWDEFHVYLKKAFMWMLGIACFVVVILGGMYMWTKLHPEIITKEKVIYLPKEEYQKQANLPQQQTNNQNINQNYVPISQITKNITTPYIKKE
ncbi:MAG: hypothetical protein ABGW69_03420 [Nanoarchaeota archaeon]